MPSRLAMPSKIAEVYFDFDWDKRKVWKIGHVDRQVPRRT